MGIIRFFFRNSGQNKEFWGKIALFGLYFAYFNGIWGGNFALKRGGASGGQLGPGQNKDFVAEYTPMAQRCREQ